MSSPIDRLASELAGRYTIERELGAGGMATVYLAHDIKHDRKVAIKVLRPELAHAIGPERFLREISTTAQLANPHILPLHDSGNADGTLFYVMPLLEGESLADLIEREKQLSLDEALRITREVATALSYAHSRGVIHRDIKPDNILLSGGTAVVADFGIATALSEAGGDKLTQTGIALGTPMYMSPEQGGGSEVDARTDIYALACVLYEMLSGHPPFSGSNVLEILARHSMDHVPPLKTARPTVPDSVENAIQKAMAKVPADRFRTATQFVEALTSSDSEPAMAARSAPARSRKVWSVVGAAAAVVVALAATIFALMPSGPGAAGLALVDDLVAVVPFTVRGSPEVEYLGEGIVDLVSAKLDGAGDLRAVNPRITLALVNQESIDVADPSATRRVAAQLGAGRYVTGDILEAGGRLTLTAYLFDTGVPDAPLNRASTEGQADELFDVIDGLVAQLLAGFLVDSTDRLQALATITTSSLDAAKAYLDGERLMRSGQYRAAAAAYDRAVDLDSAFALAYYRKAIAAEWIDAADQRSSAERAYALADRLSARDRDLLNGLRLRRVGRSNEAEQAYRSHLNLYPDDVEALVQFGELLFHENPRRGRPLTESMEPFQRAVQLEPWNLMAQIHVARSYALHDSTEALARTAAFLAEMAPESERALEVDALYAFASGDTVQQRRVREALPSKPWFYTFYAAHGVDRFARAPHAAADLLARRTSNEPLLLTMHANMLIARGRHAEFREFLSGLLGQGNPTWDLYQAFVLISGAYPATDAELESALERVRRTSPAEILSTSIVPPYEDITLPYAVFERDFLATYLLIHLGRDAEARRLIDHLAAADSFPGLGTMQHDAVADLEAEMLYLAGRRHEALERLRTIEGEVPHAAAYRVVADGTRARFLRAELEREVGDPRVARRYYQGIDESWSPWDTFYRPRAYIGLGAIAEADGRTEEAVVLYGRLLDAWRDCDSACATVREEIRSRRDALIAQR